MTPEIVTALWKHYFPDVALLPDTVSFLRRFDPDVLFEALSIAAEKDKSGRFTTRDGKNIGRYLYNVCRNIRKARKVVAQGGER